MKEISTVKLDTDILIIGGGAAGCMAAIEAKKLDQSIKCIVMEKATYRLGNKKRKRH
jgi:adenylylsulfate reductase subunit A